jgi:predicted aldo/keto reductase-like oxidoreductase
LGRFDFSFSQKGFFVMLYKTYGSTGIELSAIGFGGMRFAHPEDIETNASLVKAAYDAGINYFDTAPGYCEDKSEQIIGTAVRQMLKTRSERPFYVSTKSAKDNPAEVRKDLEKSLKVLGVDCIDFYHVWCIITQEAYQKRKANGVLAEFEKMRDEGLVHHICVSTHMTGPDIGAMLNDYGFDGMLLGYSAMNFSYRTAGIDAAAKLGRGVVVMNPLGGGLIPQNPKRFDFVKTRVDESVVEGALRFLINDPRITTALVGFSSEQQLREAIAGVDGFEPISDEKVSQIRAGIKDAFNELCTGCRYCDKCPEGIAVPSLMDTYNQKLLGASRMDVINRLRWHWGISLDDKTIRSCTHCGTCESLCTQKLPICDRIEDLIEYVDAFLAEEKKKKQ